MGFDEAKEKGIVEPEADFFTVNMSFPEEWDWDRRSEARNEARDRIDEIWYGICYGPFGAGPWKVMTKGVMNGWKNVFTCSVDEAFQDIGSFDWRCASLGTDVDDVLEMSEMCPISGNATIIGGIDLALDFAEKGGLSTSQRSRVVRFLKRAFGELYKRGKAMLKINGKEVMLSQFFRQVRNREWAAQDFFGGAVMPRPEECRVREDLAKDASRMENERALEIFNQKFDPLHLDEMNEREILDCMDVVNSVMLSGAELTREVCDYGWDILKKLGDALLARMRADIEKIDFAAEAVRMEREFE